MCHFVAQIVGDVWHLESHWDYGTSKQTREGYIKSFPRCKNPLESDADSNAFAKREVCRETYYHPMPPALRVHVDDRIILAATECLLKGTTFKKIKFQSRLNESDLTYANNDRRSCSKMKAYIFPSFYKACWFDAGTDNSFKDAKGECSAARL